MLLPSRLRAMLVTVGHGIAPYQSHQNGRSRGLLPPVRNPSAHYRSHLVLKTSLLYPLPTAIDKRQKGLEFCAVERSRGVNRLLLQGPALTAQLVWMAGFKAGCQNKRVWCLSTLTVIQPSTHPAIHPSNHPSSHPLHEPSTHPAIQPSTPPIPHLHTCLLRWWALFFSRIEGIHIRLLGCIVMHPDIGATEGRDDDCCQRVQTHCQCPE